MKTFQVVVSLADVADYIKATLFVTPNAYLRKQTNKTPLEVMTILDKISQDVMMESPAGEYMRHLEDTLIEYGINPTLVIELANMVYCQTNGIIKTAMRENPEEPHAFVNANMINDFDLLLTFVY